MIRIPREMDDQISSGDDRRREDTFLIRGYRGLLALILAFVLAAGTAAPLSAAQPAAGQAGQTGKTAAGQAGKQEKELTEEEKKLQAELDAAYRIPTESNSWDGWPKGPGTYGDAAIVMEADTGAILYAKNIDSKQYPASITKVLTALIALENGNLSDTVTFSHDCVSFLQPGDSSIGLKEGNVITLEQALYATLLASANEAAYAVGENVGKNAGHDYSWFIARMNERVKELGGVNSHFANTNGLPDPDHYTCARDMALIGRELFKHPEFFTIVQTMQYEIPKSKTVEEHVFQQKHKMLHKGDPNYYKYVIGGKTGYTSEALSTLITMAQKGDMKLVCVVLRTHGKNVYPDTKRLLKYAFKNFTKIKIAEQEQSPDIGEVLPVSEAQEACVAIPKTAAFADLAAELKPDGEASPEGTVSYTLGGHYVGEARVKLEDTGQSEQELEFTPAEGDEPERTDAEEEDSAGKSGSSVFDRLLDRLGIADKSPQEKGILTAAVGILGVLVVLFLFLLIRLNVKRRQKSIRRRRRLEAKKAAKREAKKRKDLDG